MEPPSVCKRAPPGNRWVRCRRPALPKPGSDSTYQMGSSFIWHILTVEPSARPPNPTQVTSWELTSVKNNNDLRNLCSSLGNTLRKYPFRSSSTDDASLEEFAGIFHPATGAIWQFQQQSLADLTIKEGSLWKPKDPTKKPQLTPEMLAFLNRAQSIADVFYPGGATQAQFTYILRPQLDNRLKEFTLELEIDGRPHQWPSSFQHTFNWPPPPGSKDIGAEARLRTAANVRITI